MFPSQWNSDEFYKNLRFILIHITCPVQSPVTVHGKIQPSTVNLALVRGQDRRGRYIQALYDACITSHQPGLISSI